MLSSETILPEGKKDMFSKNQQGTAAPAGADLARPLFASGPFPPHNPIDFWRSKAEQPGWSPQILSQQNLGGFGAGGQQVLPPARGDSDGGRVAVRGCGAQAAAITYAFLSSSILLICPPTNTRILHFPHRFLRPRR